eukprot:TRINITY_DN556_c0_g2_i1.p1 TRINITY_DN556_c0_g2~~TRINITY_DN556_c0_g2_i1.p1  ORF type:complete len:704 (-),score=189.39 TRINITY_DN556_c0_g2_i1:800-2746(-)
MAAAGSPSALAVAAVALLLFTPQAADAFRSSGCAAPSLGLQQRSSQSRRAPPCQDPWCKAAGVGLVPQRKRQEHRVIMSDAPLSAVGVVINTVGKPWGRRTVPWGREREVVQANEPAGGSAAGSYTYKVSVRKPLGLELMESEGKGVLISNVWAGSNAEKAGVMKGDRVVATSATLGGAMWEKNTIDGVISAITSRLILSDEVVIQLERYLDGHKTASVPPKQEAAESLAQPEHEEPTLAQLLEAVAAPMAGEMTLGSVGGHYVTAEEAYNAVPVVQQPATQAQVAKAAALASAAPLDQRARQAVTMLLRFGEMGSLEGFPQVWAAVRRTGPRQPQVYHAAMQAMLKLGSPDGAVALFKEMQETGLAPGLAAYTTLIKAHGRARDTGLKDAFDAIRGARAAGYTPDIVAYNALLGTCARRKELQAAEQLFWGEMQGQSTVADAISWNTLLNAYARAGDVDKAEALLEKMEAQGVSADRVTYTTLMKSLVADGRVDEAARLLRSMEQQQADILDDGDIVEAELVGPDVRAYNTLIEGRLKLRNCCGALSVLDEMKRAGVAPDLMTHSLLMDGLIRAGMPRQAMDTFASMRAAGIAPNLHVYTTAIAAAAALRASVRWRGWTTCCALQTCWGRGAATAVAVLMALSIWRC